MSWTLHETGTAAHLRQRVQEHETQYWTHLSTEERLVLHHVLGHVLKLADAKPTQRWILEGNGHQAVDGTGFVLHLQFGPEPRADAP
jgi:hypothetical protein